MTQAPASLHVDTERRWRGGQQQVLHLLEGLAARGLRAELAAPPDSALAGRARAAGFTVHPIRMRGEWDLPSAARLAAAVRRGGFGVVHLHTSRAHGLGRVASLLVRMPGVVVSRRVVFRVRGGLVRRFKYLCGVDKYLAISYAVRDVLIAAGVAGERVAVVHSGVDPARFGPAPAADVRGEFGLPADALLLGVVGHLDVRKGQRDFLAAAARIAPDFSGARFLLVGDGGDAPALRDLAATLGIAERVIFAGFRTDVPAVLAALDVFVMPSHAEGLCTAAVEAMMAGLPVVATSAGGLPEVVEDGQTGLLVPPGAPEALAGAAAKLLADADLRRRLGERGRQRALERFSVGSMVDGTIAVYEAVAAGLNATRHE